VVPIEMVAKGGARSVKGGRI